MSNVSRAGGTDPNNATSSTTFGRSMESQAQINDNRLTGSTEGVPGEPLNVYRLVPIAAANDANWGNAPSSGEVVVAARTSGDARIVAAARELDFTEIDSAPADDVTTANASAFRNEKLYTVIEIDRDRSDLKRGLIKGQITVGNIRPTQD